MEWYRCVFLYLIIFFSTWTLLSYSSIPKKESLFKTRVISLYLHSPFDYKKIFHLPKSSILIRKNKSVSLGSDIIPSKVSVLLASFSLVMESLRIFEYGFLLLFNLVLLPEKLPILMH